MASGKRKRKPKAHDVGGFPEKSHRRTFGRQVWICKPVAFQLSFGQNLPDQLKPRCKIAKARMLEPNGWTFLQERPPTITWAREDNRRCLDPAEVRQRYPPPVLPG